ncbi:MAG TPA: hypothetical protein DCX25_00060 [Candidatus Pacebacteria bacterium]|nr:MAG: hypothetical protein UW89_C0021G0008 [Parcubacteria group bacterium GW2011_GWB1_45_10]KKU16747.1 MAG: hypothetical protein UX26_C0017G0006 [Parcubacteria group bacterium GW2011_GWC1_45_9]HAV14714.1 hypothetical protein [Candidatus Paceibacterota bacterium]HCI05528.1 hypothetical protein [Patescibacteria group bacterium]
MEINIDPRDAKLFLFSLFCGFLIAAVAQTGMEEYGKAIWNLILAGGSYFFWDKIEIPDENPKRKKKTRR